MSSSSVEKIFLALRSHMRHDLEWDDERIAVSSNKLSALLLMLGRTVPVGDKDLPELLRMVANTYEILQSESAKEQKGWYKPDGD